jgi:hypothetical protein
LTALRQGDRVAVYHLPELGRKRGRLLTGVLFLDREQETSGRVAAVDPAAKRMTVEVDGRKLNLPLHAECRITLRDAGGTVAGSSTASLNDVKQGDLVSVKYDTEFREIHVSRGPTSFPERSRSCAKPGAKSSSRCGMKPAR